MPILHSPSARPAPQRALALTLAVGLTAGLGACAQPGASRMGGPADSASPDSYQQPRRVERQRQSALPGDVNQTDSNLERPDQLPKSGPPSTANPEQ